MVPWEYTVSFPLFGHLPVVETRELGCRPRTISERSWETEPAGRGEKILFGRDLELQDLIPVNGRKEFGAFAMCVGCVGAISLMRYCLCCQRSSNRVRPGWISWTRVLS